MPGDSAPVVLLLLAALTGVLTRAVGVVLVVLFLAFVGWVAVREYASRRPVFRNAGLYEELERVGAWPGDGRAQPLPEPPSGAFTLPADLRVDQGFLRARRVSAPAGAALVVLALVGLSDAVAGARTLQPELLCDLLLERFDISGREDDVAILVVRSAPDPGARPVDGEAASALGV